MHKSSLTIESGRHEKCGTPKMGLLNTLGVLEGGSLRNNAVLGGSHLSRDLELGMACLSI